MISPRRGKSKDQPVMNQYLSQHQQESLEQDASSHSSLNSKARQQLQKYKKRSRLNKLKVTQDYLLTF